MRSLFLAAIYFFSILVIVPVTAETIEKPFLYAISKNNKTSFLLGSLHFGITLGEMPEFVIDAIRSREILIAERSIEDALLEQDLNFKKTNSWPKSVRTALTERGLTDDIIDHAKPSEMCGKYFMWHFVADHAYKETSLDAQIILLGKELSMEFYPLDTNKRLIKAAKKELNKDCTLDALTELVQKLPPKKVPSALERRLQPDWNAYRTGDERFLTLLNPGKILYPRNRHWMRRLKRLHRDGYFAVVGAAHLAPDHPQGLIPLFEKHGYSITRVNEENISTFINMR